MLAGPPYSQSQKVLKDRGIDKMVKEARDDNRENDAEHMKPVSAYFQASLLTCSTTPRNDNDQCSTLLPVAYAAFTSALSSKL